MRKLASFSADRTVIHKGHQSPQRDVVKITKERQERHLHNHDGEGGIRADNEKAGHLQHVGEGIP